MFNYPLIRKFLEAQKLRLLKLDGATEETSFMTERELSGYDYVQENEDTGDRRGIRAIMYDNAINWMMSRKGRQPLYMEHMQLSQAGVIQEDTLTTGIQTFTTALLPLIRRFYTSLIAMDLVSVQPLTGPTGFLYWLDPLFTDTHVADSIVGGTTRKDQVAAETYSDSSEQGTIREMQLRIRSQQITAVTKKLKGDWTIEAEQDMSSQWKLNLENELMPVIGDEITREIDRLILGALLAAVNSAVSWNSAGYLAGDTTTLYRKAYDATIWDAIVDASANIYNSFYIPPSWLVMNGTTYARIQKLDNYVGDPTIASEQAFTQRRYVGILANQYKVYVDPWFTADTILVGARGADWKRAVGYFSPYIPLFMSDKYIINDDFTQFARGAMSRYAYGHLPADKNSSVNYGLARVNITTS